MAFSNIPALDRWDGLKFEVFWRDELVSRVQVKENTAYIDRIIQHPCKQLFGADKMNIFQLSQVFEDRCWERGRDDIDIILKNLGLNRYDPYDIVHKTHGKKYDDCIWFKFEGENYSYIDMMTRNRIKHPIIWKIKKSFVHLKRHLAFC